MSDLWALATGEQLLYSALFLYAFYTVYKSKECCFTSSRVTWYSYRQCWCSECLNFLLFDSFFLICTCLYLRLGLILQMFLKTSFLLPPYSYYWGERPSRVSVCSRFSCIGSRWRWGRTVLIGSGRSQDHTLPNIPLSPGTCDPNDTWTHKVISARINMTWMNKNLSGNVSMMIHAYTNKDKINSPTMQLGLSVKCPHDITTSP